MRIRLNLPCNAFAVRSIVKVFVGLLLLAFLSFALLHVAEAKEILYSCSAWAGSLFFLLLLVILPWSGSLRLSRDRLRESERHLREITDTLGEGIFVLDRQGQTTFFNPATETILGWTASDLRGQDLHAVFHVHRDREACPVMQTLRTGQTHRSEQEQFRRRDGTMLPVSVIASPIVRDGVTTAVVVVFNDITERFQAQQSLAELLDFNQKIIAESATGILAYRAVGPCVLANEAAARIVGTTTERLLSQNYRTIRSWQQSALLETAELALATRCAQRCEVHILTSFGKDVWMECDLTPFTSKGEVHLMLMANDISPHRQAAQFLLEAKQAAEEASRVKSVFLANMSHEIRTPMNAILGLTQLVLGMELTPRVQDYLGKVHASARSLLGILNDILDYSKIEAGRLTLEAVDFDLEQLLESTTTLFAASAWEKEIELFVAVQPEVPCILHGDPLRLGQILNNLVGNAIKFTQSGEVQMGVDVIPRPEGGVVLQVAVQDTGIGMTAEQMDQLFQPFQQADGSITRRYGGTGLGLAITRSLVEQMGGQIEVESQPNEGSCFRFQVQMQAAVPAEPDAPPRPPLRFRTVLVVDDNATAREILRHSLQRWGLQVEVVTSGEAALALLQAGCRYDLFLIDLRLPGLDGLTLARQMGAAGYRREAAIVLIRSSVGVDEQQQESATACTDALLDNPVIPSRLLDALLVAQGELRATVRRRDVTPVEQMRPVRGCHILLVEDNEINQLVTMKFLQSMGLRVSIAGDGQQAIEALQREAFDLVLMDLQMPRMDGWAATRIIRGEAVWRELPIIAMTAAAMPQDRERALAVGMNEHVAKPIDPARLAAVLLAWLPRRAEPVVEEPLAMAVPAEPDGLPESLPGFDLERGLAPLGGDRRLWRQLVARFAEDFAQVETEMTACLLRRDREAERQQVHRLRGVAGNLGAMTLHAAATLLEERLQTGKHVNAARKRFRQALTEALASACVLRDMAEEPPAVQVSRFDPVAAQLLLSRLAEYRERGKFVTETMVEETRALFVGSPHVQAVEEVLRKLDLFDFEGAEPLLRRLQERLQVAHPECS
ncbi:MAG: response regulator [Magnetococcales bacterium]|nr:response regulator [Magnetococcales bacterium]